MFCERGLYLLEVYPPKNFSYHVLTKYHHQYLKDGVVNNFTAPLRKSGTPENFRNADCVVTNHHKVQAT